MEFHEVMAVAKPREATVRLCLDQSLNSEHERLEEALDAARKGPDTTSMSEPVKGYAIAQQITELEARSEAAKVTFVLRALGHKAWSDLLAAHPPEDPEVSTFNLLTFPPALIAACSLDPIMSEEQVSTELFEVLNWGQRNLLFNTAFAANTGVDVPFSLAASATLQTYGLKSSSPEPGGNPDPSSSDE